MKFAIIFAVLFALVCAAQAQDFGYAPEEFQYNSQPSDSIFAEAEAEAQAAGADSGIAIRGQFAYSTGDEVYYVDPDAYEQGSQQAAQQAAHLTFAP